METSSRKEIFDMPTLQAIWLEKKMQDFDKDHISDLIQDFVDAGLLSKKVAQEMTDLQRISWLQKEGIIKHDYE